MELHFTITPEDFIQTQIFHNENSKMGKRLRWIVGAVGLLILLLFTTIICRGFYIIPAFSAVLYVAWWFLRSKKQARKNLRRQYVREIREGKYHEHLGVQSLHLEEDRIRSTSSRTTVEMSYGNIAYVEKDNARFYIYTGTTGNTMIVLPFAAFANEDEKQRFLALITEKAPQTWNPSR